MKGLNELNDAAIIGVRPLIGNSSTSLLSIIVPGRAPDSQNIIFSIYHLEI